MARFRPFRAIRYARARVGDLTPVVAPPYDVIAAAERDALQAASPYNVVRLILNREGHDAAAAQYRAWLASGVLARDAEPSFYLYAQDFEADGPRRRIGVLGALALEPFRSGIVLRHESTFEHHKQDRLELTRRVKTNLSPIFATYSNPDLTIEPDAGWDAPADVDVVHQDVRHRMWCVRRAETIDAIQAAVAERTLFIADGHHRYETALNYYAEISGGAEPPLGNDAPGDDAAPEAHVLAFLATFEDPGLVILPTHRALQGSGGADHRRFEAGLARAFTVTRFPRSDAGRDALLAALHGCEPDVNGFAVSLAELPHDLLVCGTVDGERAARSPLEALDVHVLHERILGTCLREAGGGEPVLAYSIDARDLLARVSACELEGAFLMNPTRPEQMAAVCRAGRLMPHKSTYFYPKLLSGLLFHSLERASGAACAPGPATTGQPQIVR